MPINEKYIIERGDAQLRPLQPKGLKPQSAPDLPAMVVAGESLHARATDILRRLESLGEQLYGDNTSVGKAMSGASDTSHPGHLVMLGEALDDTHTTLTEIENKIDGIFERLALAQPASLSQKAKAPAAGGSVFPNPQTTRDGR